MNANLISDMLSETESGNVAYTEFLLAYDSNPKSLYCFMEGGDDLFYYNSRIRETLPAMTIYAFNCNGKEEVIRVYYLIKKNAELKQSKSAFFIDRDFDPPFMNPEIYETPFHSIENFYSDKIAVERILRDVFKIYNHASDLAKCINIYHHLHSEVLQKSQPVNAWISCYIDKRHSNTLTKKINIQDKTSKLFTQVISSDMTEIGLNNEIISFENLQIYFDSYDISRAEYDFKLGLFAISDPEMTNRGKFELQFLWNFLEKIKIKLLDKTDMFCSKTYKVKLNFRLETMLLELSIFAITPLCLKEYIQKFAT